MPVGREWALIQKLEPNYIPGVPRQHDVLHCFCRRIDHEAPATKLELVILDVG
jgi:hypothetical protein